MSNRLASSLGTTGSLKYFTISSSNPYPSFDIPLFLPKNNGPDFVSSSSFTQGVGIYEYNNFTISTGHQMILNPGVTIIRCAGTFTCGGNGIIGALGDSLTVGDGYTREPGTDGLGIVNSNGGNATGAGTTGGGGSGGLYSFQGSIFGGTGFNGGAAGGGASGSNNGNDGTATQGGAGATVVTTTGSVAGGAGGLNGTIGQTPGCLIVIANVINISSNITLIGGNGSNADNGSNGNVNGNGTHASGGGGGGAGGRGAQGGIFIGLGNTINHSSGVINVSGGNGGNGGNGGDGRNASSYPSGGGGAGPGGAGGNIGFVFLKAQDLTASGTITANGGNPGSPGSPGVGGVGGSNPIATAGYNAGTSTVGAAYSSLNAIQTITGSPF